MLKKSFLLFSLLSLTFCSSLLLSLGTAPSASADGGRQLPYYQNCTYSDDQKQYIIQPFDPRKAELQVQFSQKGIAGQPDFKQTYTYRQVSGKLQWQWAPQLSLTDSFSMTYMNTISVDDQGKVFLSIQFQAPFSKAPPSTYQFTCSGKSSVTVADNALETSQPQETAYNGIEDQSLIGNDNIFDTVSLTGANNAEEDIFPQV